MKTILVVEDDENDRHIVATFLEHFGYRVLTAVNAFQGLGIAEREKPDAIVVDLHMPGMSGFDFARRIRADPAIAHTPMLALSAFTDTFPQAQYADAGFDATQLKPVTPGDLRSQIAGLLGVER